MRRLLSGELPLSAYAALAAQNYAIYTALEDAGESWQASRSRVAFVFDELSGCHRSNTTWRTCWARAGATTRADSSSRRPPATSPNWSRTRRCGPAPSSLTTTCGTSATFPVARSSPGTWLTSTAKPDSAARRSTYSTASRRSNRSAIITRTLLDACAFDAAERRTVVADAIAAFELNRAVFADLAGRSNRSPHRVPRGWHASLMAENRPHTRLAGPTRPTRRSLPSSHCRDEGTLKERNTQCIQTSSATGARTSSRSDRTPCVREPSARARRERPSWS